MRIFPLIFVPAQCEHQIGLPKSPSVNDVTCSFAFVLCKRTLSWKGLLSKILSTNVFKSYGGMMFRIVYD